MTPTQTTNVFPIFKTPASDGPEITNSKCLLMEQQLTENTAKLNQTSMIVEWGWRLILVIAAVGMAYQQLQLGLAVAQLELKIERQRVEDVQTRPSNRDLDRLERQIMELQSIIVGRDKQPVYK